MPHTLTTKATAPGRSFVPRLRHWLARWADPADRKRMFVQRLYALLGAVGAMGVALVIGFAALYFSPRDPREDEPPRGGPVVVSRQQPLTGVAKGRQILAWVAAGRSIKLHKPVWGMIVGGLFVTVPLNLGGLVLGFGAAYAVGLWAGNRLGRPDGRLAMIGLLGLVVIPAPFQIELLRSLLVQYGPFNIGDLLPAVLTLGWVAFPAVAVNHAVAVARARRSPALLLARGVGARRAFVRRLVFSGTRGFWQTQMALLLVSLIEGPILVEYAFDLHGTGLLALKTIESADAAVVLPLVGLSAAAVNLGVLLFGTASVAAPEAA